MKQDLIKLNTMAKKINCLISTFDDGCGGTGLELKTNKNEVVYFVDDGKLTMTEFAHSWVGTLSDAECEIFEELWPELQDFLGYNYRNSFTAFN